MDENNKQLERELKKQRGKYNHLKFLYKNKVFELKQNETALRESETKYRFMFDKNSQPCWIYEYNTLSFLDVNEAAVKQYGYSVEEFLEMTLKDICEIEEIQNSLEHNESKNSHLENWVTECILVNKRGELIFVEILSQPLHLNNRNIVHATIHDITKRKRLENELTQSKKNFYLAIADSPIAIRIVTLEGKTVYANKAFLDMYEINSVEEFLAMSTIDRYTPESYLQHQDRKEKRKRGLDVFKYEVSLRCRNKICYIKVLRKEILWNGIPHFQVIMQDITEQRNAEEKYRIFSVIVEQSPNSVYLTNADGIIEYVNSRTVELTGYTKSELIGAHTRIFRSGLHNKEQYSLLWQMIKSGSVWNGELYNKKKDGNCYWESIKISPIYDNRGTIAHYFAINDDVSFRKKILEDLTLAKKVTEKSEIFLRTFIENIPFEVWARDINSVGILENKMHVDHFGTIIGNELKSNTVIDQQNLLRWEDNINCLLRGETVNDECEYNINYQQNIFQEIAFPIYINEEILGIAGFNINITAKKLSEIALQSSEDELKKFASYLQNVREEERDMLAREIHDDLGQILVALKIDLGLLKQKVLNSGNLSCSNDIFSGFDNLSNLINDTIKTTRRIITGLRSDQLELLGLEVAIKEYLLDFEDRHKLVCRLKWEIDEFEINQQQTLTLFRILQEALTNITKHAKATVVEVELTSSENKLVMEIVDDGIGFDVKNSGRDDSYGMIGMKERVFLLKGELIITSKVGTGTSVRVEIPYLI